MDKEEKALNLLGLIATRKTELYENLVEEIPEEELDDQDKEELRNRISKMDNEAFLTEEEIEKDEANPENSVEDLDINIEGLIKNLGLSEYFEEEKEENSGKNGSNQHSTK